MGDYPKINEIRELTPTEVATMLMENESVELYCWDDDDPRPILEEILGVEINGKNQNKMSV